MLPDAGHVCNIEAPDEFNDAVRNFLEREPQLDAQAWHHACLRVQQAAFDSEYACTCAFA